MSHTELSDRIENIEASQHLITNRQIITILCTVVAAVAGACVWWFTGQEKDKDTNTGIVNSITEIRYQLKSQNEQLISLIKAGALKDSIDRMQIKSTLEKQNIETQGHFLIIEEKIKHLAPLGYITERRTGEKIMATLH